MQLSTHQASDPASSDPASAQRASIPSYRFRPTIKVHRYGDQVLLWDPTTGSWCFISQDALPLMEGLRYLCDEGADPREGAALPAPAYALLDELVACGLVAKDGRYSWSEGFFNPP